MKLCLMCLLTLSMLFNLLYNLYDQSWTYTQHQSPENAVLGLQGEEVQQNSERPVGSPNSMHAEETLHQFSENNKARICSVEERLERVQKWCTSQMGRIEYTFKRFEDIDKEELKRFTAAFWVDEKHKVIFCDVPKAG